MKMNNYLDEIDYGDDPETALNWISSRLLHDMNKKQARELFYTKPSFFVDFHIECEKVTL